MVCKFHFVLRTIIEKTEIDGSKITKDYTSRTPVYTLMSNSDFKQKSNEIFSQTINSLSSNIELLERTPSGFKVREIISLTIVSTPLPSIKGGCKDSMLSLSKGEKRGLFEIRSNQKKCLRDSILFSYHGKSIFKEIRHDNMKFCDATTHSTFCKCYRKSENQFLDLVSNGEYWDNFSSEIDFQGVSYPGSLHDLNKIWMQNKEKFHIKVYLEESGEFYPIFSTLKNENHDYPKNNEVASYNEKIQTIFLVFKKNFSTKTLEIEVKKIDKFSILKILFLH